MNVYLIKTPEYDLEDLEEVQELLSAVEGPLKFEINGYEFSSETFPFLKKFWAEYQFPGVASDMEKLGFDKGRGLPLSFKELFSLCTYFRQGFRIAERDFVVLLTHRKNALNWFSNCDHHRNIFVHTGDWAEYTKAPSKYPIAYQIVENIMQNLMKVDIDQSPSPYIHFDPLGCMNDFCQDKRQIILKLRTGDICYDCLSKMQQEQVDDRIIDQAIGIFEKIRTQVLFKQGFTRNTRPKPVSITEEGKIWIGEKPLLLNPLESTLFIFFLKYKDGITLNDLADYRDELYRIYQVVKRSAEKNTIDELVKPYTENGTFSVKKSQLNKKLKSELGEQLANFYCIDGNRGEAFKINIHPDLVSFGIQY